MGKKDANQHKNKLTINHRHPIYLQVIQVLCMFYFASYTTMHISNIIVTLEPPKPWKNEGFKPPISGL